MPARQGAKLVPDPGASADSATNVMIPTLNRCACASGYVKTGLRLAMCAQALDESMPKMTSNTRREGSAPR
jgi:hypothetical protein